MLRPVELTESLIGQPLPWDVFTDAGVRVANAGLVIRDAAHFLRLTARPLYRRSDPGARAGIGLLQRLEALAREIDTLLQPPLGMLFHSQFEAWLDALTHTLHQDADACLGYLRRARLARPGVQHALHVLMVAQRVAQSFGLTPAQQYPLAGAAMTMNLAVLEVQDRLAGLPAAPDEAERARLAAHPLDAVELLRGGGVDHPDWLAAVAQHHENMDGSGYPAGLDSTAITLLARILRASDVYCAQLSARHYRPAQSPERAMHALFARHRQHLDLQVCTRLLHRFGLHPPGTLVRLTNGECACITRAGQRHPPPFAVSFLDGAGRLLVPPRERALTHPATALRGYLQPDPNWPTIDWQTLWDTP